MAKPRRSIIKANNRVHLMRMFTKTWYGADTATQQYCIAIYCEYGKFVNVNDIFLECSINPYP